MFLNFMLTAARVIELRANQNAINSAESLLKEFSGIHTVEDNKVANDSFVIKTGDLSFSAEDKNILKDLLALASSLNEMPTQMKEIMQTLAFIPNDMVSELKTGAYNFAVIFTNEPDAIKNLKGAESNPSVKLFLSTKKSDADGLGVPFPGVLCYSAVDKNTFTGPIPRNFQSLLASLSVASFTTINQENFRFLQTLDQKLFYLIDKNKSFEENRNLFNSTAKLCASFARFLFFTPEDVPALIPLLHLKESDYPVLVSLAKEGKGIYRSVSPDSFLAGVQSLMTNQAEKLIFSSPLPENNDSLPVRVINTDTIKSFVEAKNNDVIIAFTSPSCRFCTALEPIFKQLGQILIEKKVPITLGNYNVIENEEPVGFELSGVPTLYLIKKGGANKIDIPSDARTLEGFLKLLAKEGDSSKINIDDFSEHIQNAKEENKENEHSSHDNNEKPEVEDVREDVL